MEIKWYVYLNGVTMPIECGAIMEIGGTRCVCRLAFTLGLQPESMQPASLPH